MKIIEKYIDDIIAHIEKCIEYAPIEKQTAKDKDYIEHCGKLALTMMAVAAGKKAYDKHMPSHAPHEYHPVHNPIPNHNPVNL